ncbi:hypothetical protein OSTOST_15803, partial [Ostertagia ostertagi]
MNVQLTIGALVVNFLQGASLRFIGMDDITPKMLYVAVNNSDMFGPPRYSDLNALCTTGERRNELEVNTAEDSSTLTSFASSDVLLLDELPTEVDDMVEGRSDERCVGNANFAAQCVAETNASNLEGCKDRCYSSLELEPDVTLECKGSQTEGEDATSETRSIITNAADMSDSLLSGRVQLNLVRDSFIWQLTAGQPIPKDTIIMPLYGQISFSQKV